MGRLGVLSTHWQFLETAISIGEDKAFNGIFNGTDYAQATTGNTATVSGLGITGINKIRVNIAKNGGSDNWGTFALDSTDLTSWATE